MEFRLLGWAGVQLRSGTSTLVIDPLQDAAAVWARAGEAAREVPLPPVVPADPPGQAAVGLVTHLHRDHADAGALGAALAPGARILGPEPYGGLPEEEAALMEAAGELATAGLDVDPVSPWQQLTIDGWEVTALPAVDGSGDPQVSWMVTRDGATVVHAGDTMWHGWWWRVAQRAPGRIDVAFLPVNGARLAVPHRRPPSPRPAVMTADEAALAAVTMGARRLVPIHHGAYTFPPVYVPDEAPLRALASVDPSVPVLTPALGEWVAVTVDAA